MDAANMLKPMLARGELRRSAPPRWTSTASTSRRTRRWSGGSSRCWWASRASTDTIAILRGLKERYEVHHGVRISDDAMVAAAMLSDRYIADRFLPDKAIDLMDEAASRLKIEIDSMPHGDRRGPAAHDPARDRAGGDGEGDAPRRPSSGARRWPRSWPICASSSTGMKAEWESEKEADQARPER